MKLFILFNVIFLFFGCKPRHASESELAGRSSKKYSSVSTSKLEKQIENEFGITMSRWVTSHTKSSCPLPEYNQFMSNFLKTARLVKLPLRQEKVLVRVKRENWLGGWLNPDNWGPDLGQIHEDSISVGSKSWDWAVAYLNNNLDLAYVELSKKMQQLIKLAYGVSIEKDSTLQYKLYVSFLKKFHAEADSKGLRPNGELVKATVDYKDHTKFAFGKSLQKYVKEVDNREFEVDYVSAEAFVSKLIEDGYLESGSRQ